MKPFIQEYVLAWPVALVYKNKKERIVLYSKEMLLMHRDPLTN